MPSFFSYVPVDDLARQHSIVTLLKSADTKAALLSDATYDPDQVGSIDASEVVDTGKRKKVTNNKTGAVVSAAVCEVE